MTRKPIDEDEWGTMDRDTFLREWSTIRTELKVILSTRGKTRRRFRLLAMYESASGELLGEILRTSVGPVIRHRVNDVSEKYDRENPKHVGFRQRHKWRVVPFKGAEQTIGLMASGHGGTPGSFYHVFGEHIVGLRPYPDDAIVFK